MSYGERSRNRSTDLIGRIKQFALGSRNLKLIKGLGFTITEAQDQLALDAWLEAQLAGDEEKALDILFAGIMFEHFQSLVSEVPEDVSEEERQILKRLEEFFDEALNEETERKNPVVRESNR